MASTYSLSTEFASLMQEVELTEEQLKRFDELEVSLPFKLENCCKWIANVNADVEAFKAEEKRLADRRRVIENNVQSFKEYVQHCMETADIYKIDAGTFKLSLAKKPAAVQIYSESMIPAKFHIISTRIDKVALKEALKNGEVIEGAALESNGLSLRIK